MSNLRQHFVTMYTVILTKLASSRYNVYGYNIPHNMDNPTRVLIVCENYAISSYLSIPFKSVNTRAVIINTNNLPYEIQFILYHTFSM